VTHGACRSDTLQIVSLNTWGGQAIGPLLDFIRAEAPTTDLFCFQEVLNASAAIDLACGFRTKLLAELASALPDFEATFDPVVTWDQPADHGPATTIPFGLATFSRRTLTIGVRRAAHVIDHLDTLDAVPGMHGITRWLQLTEVLLSGRTLLVGNFHGIARPGTKLDTAERIEQSLAIRRTLDAHDGPTALVGDFNLLPETESARILAQGLRNLVLEWQIPTTRSRLNPYFGTPQEQPHADYAFISPGLHAIDFRVPDVQVSDHLPMVLTLRV
jgi:endonuclease/exonuclease/phosphatase family metal-dependent hydrolase